MNYLRRPKGERALDPTGHEARPRPGHGHRSCGPSDCTAREAPHGRIPRVRDLGERRLDRLSRAALPIWTAAAHRAAREKYPDAATERARLEEKRADVLEKDEQREIRKLFIAFGFQVYWLSQARRTGQTAGVPDLFMLHRELPVGFYWETKRQVGGKLSPAQQDFRDGCIRCGIGYGCGDRYAARTHLITLGLATVVGDTIEPVRRGER